MMKTLIVLFFIGMSLVCGLRQLGLASQQRLPIGTLFTAFNSTQTIYGNYYQYVTDVNQVATVPFSAVFAGNNGYVINGGAGIGGTQFTLPNGTYFYQEGFGAPTCLYSFVGALDIELDNLTFAAKVGEVGVFDWYLGWVNSSKTCGVGGGLQVLVNSQDGTIWEISLSNFTPLPSGVSPVPTTTTGNYQTTTAIPGYAVLPALPEACWSLDVNDPTTNYCFNLNYGFPCTGFGSFQCMPLPPPYTPQ